MASFAENGVSSESRFAPVVDNFPRDQNPRPSEILGQLATSDVNAGSTSVSQNANVSNLRNGTKNKSSGLDKYQNSSVDAPRLSDARDASALYMDGGSFAENPEGWKKCPGDLQQNRCYMENGTSGSQILGGMHNNEYVFMQPPDASINGSINMPNFPESRANVSWCHATGWPNDPSLGPSGDRSCMEWSKSLQNQFSEVNSLFSERTWRLRTSSDNDAIANKGSQPSNNRSETHHHQTQQHHHRRKGRTASGSSNSPITDASPNSDDNRSINLPTGQNVNTSDFDIQTCLAESMARLSLMSDISAAVGQRPPVMSTANTSDSMTQFMLGAQYIPGDLRTNWLLRIVFSLFNQASLANLMEKSPFFTNNSTPIYWNTGGSQQEGAFSQKLHPYHHHQRPSTSDQYTQHDTLAGTFRGYPGVTTAAYNFDQQQQAQQQFQNREDDCIWYYQDPNGRIQGGFSSEQMASWFAAGRYFTPQLLIRRKCDDKLSTLQSYIDIYGEVPFGSKVKVPPVRGGITSDLITYYRTIQTPTSFSTDLIAQMEKDPACQKLLADTGIPVRVLVKSLELPVISVIKRVLSRLCNMCSRLCVDDLARLACYKSLLEVYSPCVGLDWSLGHFEYTVGLYLITLSVRQAGRLLQTRKTILEKYAMEMVYVKTVRMHVVADLHQSSLQINDHKINRAQSKALETWNQSYGLSTSWLRRLQVDAKQMFGEKEGESWMKNPTENSILRIIEQPQMKVMDGFGKNGMNAGLPPQSNMMVQTVAKFLEMAAPSLNFNDSIYSLLSELVSKGRIDQLPPQEVRGNADSSWPSPQQCQLLSQLQEVVQRQQSTNDNSQLACTSKGTAATLNGDATMAPSSDSDRTNSSSTGSEPKSKSSRPPQQQPIGSKINASTTESSVKSNQQQRVVEQQQGRSRATTTGGQAEQTPSHTAIPKTPAVKNCWAERGAAAIIKAAAAANGCAQSTPLKSPSTAIVTPQKPVLAPVQYGTLEAANAKKRNKQSKQSSPVQSIGNTKQPENGKKTTKGGSAISRTPEMESLIQWTEQALKGVTMSVQHVDIPTLVECLVMIDGPFEVENVILDHVESTPRTQQFVRDFLDRRHTCWQQYKKQKEEEENQKKSQKSTDNVETSGYIGATKTYQEANDSSPENAWRQIKSKGGSGRRGKKGAKNRLANNEGGNSSFSRGGGRMMLPLLPKMELMEARRNEWIWELSIPVRSIAGVFETSPAGLRYNRGFPRGIWGTNLAPDLGRYDENNQSFLTDGELRDFTSCDDYIIGSGEQIGMWTR
ncbi:hypothetical protein ACTXT7_004149 [Hymenolepis weldensis]